ncbi:MAG: fimbrial major subunit CsuA/B family protein, partial [Oxalobacter sp.]|nr:fimbrial major subunit CsuA/B family protein [Oxalobacter sp.]
MRNASFYVRFCRHCINIFLILFGLPAFTLAHAATVNGIISVTITLTDSCLVNGATPTAGGTWGTLDFGSHPTGFTQADAQVEGQASSPITVQCRSATAPTVSIISGINDTQGGSHAHAMANGSNYVPYDIYSDTARSISVVNNTTFFTSANNGTVENVN